MENKGETGLQSKKFVEVVRKQVEKAGREHNVIIRRIKENEDGIEKFEAGN